MLIYGAYPNCVEMAPCSVAGCSAPHLWTRQVLGGNIEDRSSSRNEVELHTPVGLYNLYILGIYRANTVLLQTY